VSDPYFGREQTKAKHFILKKYLQALAFKVLGFSDITYVDGFSGPWQTKTENFNDTSFMIAISVLRDAQTQFVRRGIRRRVRCFFSEKNANAFAQLQEAVIPFHKPSDGFEIKTYRGEFENAISDIQTFIGASFALIFIDPTGWTGYSLPKIKPLFARPKSEALITFMYEFINRFSNSEDEDIIASLDPILGGPGWVDRLDPTIDRGAAVEKLFREALKLAGGFQFVISTKIDKATAERPHFFITYGTKSPNGLKAFREIEYAALREHERSRAGAQEKRREQRSSIPELFPGHHANIQEATIDEIVDEQKALASSELLSFLATQRSLRFSEAVVKLLQPYMLRETNVKDICVDLSKAGKIENTWGLGNRKPRDESVITLKTRNPL
jgi:three-Cys-motif partner protein